MLAAACVLFYEGRASVVQHAARHHLVRAVCKQAYFLFPDSNKLLIVGSHNVASIVVQLRSHNQGPAWHVCVASTHLFALLLLLSPLFNVNCCVASRGFVFYLLHSYGQRLYSYRTGQNVPFLLKNCQANIEFLS